MQLSPVPVLFDVATGIYFCLLCFYLANFLFSCSDSIDLFVVFAAAAAGCTGSLLYTSVGYRAQHQIGSGHSAQRILHACIDLLLCWLMREAYLQ